MFCVPENGSLNPGGDHRRGQGLSKGGLDAGRE